MQNKEHGFAEFVNHNCSAKILLVSLLEQFTSREFQPRDICTDLFELQGRKLFTEAMINGKHIRLVIRSSLHSKVNMKVNASNYNYAEYFVNEHLLLHNN